MLLAFGLLTSLLTSVKLKVFSGNLQSVFLVVAILAILIVRLNQHSLVVRRQRHDLILTYKIVFGRRLFHIR